MEGSRPTRAISWSTPGPWIFGKKIMLPAGVLKTVDHVNEKVFVNRTKDEIKNAPESTRSETTKSTAPSPARTTAGGPWLLRLGLSFEQPGTSGENRWLRRPGRAFRILKPRTGAEATVFRLLFLPLGLRSLA